MDWNAPNPINFAPHATAETKLLAFFGHLDCRVYLGEAFIDVGAGSLAAARRVINVPIGFAGGLGKIGRYVETADCRILFAGEHRNDLPVNVVFMGAASLWPAAKQAGLSPMAGVPIDIGNGVIISQGATVLSGAAIGDGAVIAAGAVVTRPVEPFGVYGGVPARKIKDRFDAATIERVKAARWWDFSVPFLAENMERIQVAAVEGGEYRGERPRYILAMDQSPGARVVGFVDGEIARPLADAPPQARAYAEQAFGSGDHYWLADPWQ